MLLAFLSNSKHGCAQLYEGNQPDRGVFNEHTNFMMFLIERF